MYWHDIYTDLCILRRKIWVIKNTEKVTTHKKFPSGMVVQVNDDEVTR